MWHYVFVVTIAVTIGYQVTIHGNSMSFKELKQQSVKKIDSDDTKEFLKMFQNAYNDTGDYLAKLNARKMYRALSQGNKIKAAYRIVAAVSGEDVAELVTMFDGVLEF